MLLAGLRERLTGVLVVECRGEGLERLINAAHTRGIVLWDIRRVSPTAALFKMAAVDFRRLRPVIRRRGIKLKIRRKRGLPFVIQRLKKRKGILLGAAAGAAVIYALSSFVWFIDVQGNNKLSAQQVLEAARTLGLERGVWRSQVDPASIARRLKEKLPQTAWVGVSQQGTRVLIKIVEKVERPPAKPGKGDLVAAGTGLVTDVLVLKGTSQVKEGQMVKKGQSLIAAGGLPAAQGFVRARVWYTGTGEAKLKDEGVKPTGNTSTGLRIKIGAKVIILTNKKSPFALYTEEVSAKSLPQWRNIRIPVELITVRYREMTHFQTEMSREEALQAAESKAKEDLERKLPQGAKIVKQQLKPVPVKDHNLVRVDIDVETQEEIAVHRES